MKFFHITSYGDMTKNSMGILEPNPVDENGNPREDGDRCFWVFTWVPLF
jgi:hypothetical protein